MTKTMEALDLFARALPPASPVVDLAGWTAPTGDGSQPERATFGAARSGDSDQDQGPWVERGHAAKEVVSHRTASHSSLPVTDRGSTAGPVRNDGLTRRGSAARWPQWIGLTLVVLILGLGSRVLVRASEQAGEACWRQGAGKSFLHAHPHAKPACQRPGSRAT